MFWTILYKLLWAKSKLCNKFHCNLFSCNSSWWVSVWIVFRFYIIATSGTRSNNYSLRKSLFLNNFLMICSKNFNYILRCVPTPGSTCSLTFPLPGLTYSLTLSLRLGARSHFPWCLFNWSKPNHMFSLLLLSNSLIFLCITAIAAVAHPRAVLWVLELRPHF